MLIYLFCSVVFSVASHITQNPPSAPALLSQNHSRRPYGKPIPMPERIERQGDRDTEDIVAEVEGAVAQIRGKKSIGSGFSVLPGIVVTNVHVIASEELDDIKVLFPSATGAKKGPFPVRLLYEDVERDLAFLEIPAKNHVPLQVVQDYPFRRDQRVIAIGSLGLDEHPVLENAVSEGVLSTQTEVENQAYYQLSISINPGDSGGPVLTSEGDVLGVMTLKGTHIEGVAFCIPHEALNQAIENVRQNDPAVMEQARNTHEFRMPLHRALERVPLLFQNGIHPEELQQRALESLEEFDAVAQRMPREADVFWGRGQARLALNDIQKALEDFETATQLAPEREDLAELCDKLHQELREQNAMTDKREAKPAFNQDRFRRMGAPGLDQKKEPPRLPAANTGSLDSTPSMWPSDS